jgi:hypothetical protein
MSNGESRGACEFVWKRPFTPIERPRYVQGEGGGREQADRQGRIAMIQPSADQPMNNLNPYVRQKSAVADVEVHTR